MRPLARKFAEGHAWGHIAVSCGYIYVVSHPKMGKGERKIGGALHHPFEVTARWERMCGDGRPLRLHSMAFVNDVNATRASINRYLKRAGAFNADIDPKSADRVLKTHLTDAMRACLAENHAVMTSAFDPETGLFRRPSDQLTGPPEHIVTEIVRWVKPNKRTAPIWKEPFTVGLIWSTLELMSNQQHIPALFVPEMYRTLVSRLWGGRPSNSEMYALIALKNQEPAEYRLGQYAFTRLMRPAMTRDLHAASAFDHLRDFIAEPRRFIESTYVAYAKEYYSKLSIQTLDAFIIILRGGVLAMLLFLLDTVYLGGGEDALMRTVILSFGIGLTLFAANFFEHPDAAGFVGLVGVREWRRGRRKLDRFEHPLETIPAAKRDDATPATAAA
jgi:hypothetical protein